VQSITVDANDIICAGGEFKNKSGHSFVAQWNGSGWSELGGKGDPFYSGSRVIRQIVGDSVGNVYVSGGFADLGGRLYLQHWNGKSWKQLAPPDTAGLSLTEVFSMVVDRKGTNNISQNILVRYHPATLTWTEVGYGTCSYRIICFEGVVSREGFKFLPR
jgi:hypothetical protein